MNRYVSVAALMVCLVAPLAGCQGVDVPTEPTTSAQVSQALAEAVKVLQQRPDYDTAVAQYDAVLKEIRTALTDAGLTPTWKKVDDASGGACPEWGDLGANYLNADAPITASWSSQAIPDPDWDRALSLVTDIIGRHGFKAPQSIGDTGGGHILNAKDTYGSSLQFWSGKRLVIGITGACFLLPGKPPVIDPNAPLGSPLPSIRPLPSEESAAP